MQQPEALSMSASAIQKACSRPEVIDVIIWQATAACTDAFLGIDGKTVLIDTLSKAGINILGSEKFHAAIKDAFILQPIRNATPKIPSIFTQH